MNESPPEIEEVAPTPSPELAAAHKRIDELARAYVAVEKDKEDFKKRLQRERDQMLEVERGKIAVSLVEAIDELDLALSAERQPSALGDGVRMIRDSLLKRVESLGLSRMSLVGLPYDPNTAEAADMEITTDPSEDQLVVAELKPAFRNKDRVVRPGRVKVAKYVQPMHA